MITVVVPVYNEDENIRQCLARIGEALGNLHHEILVVYDFDEDSTVPIVESLMEKQSAIRLVKNDLGAGVAFAIRKGFSAARGDVVVVTMADLSDPPDRIPLMADKIRNDGATIVSGSRYMRGGSQTGGPLLKRTLSRLAGLSLHYLAGLGTHDATTSFRAYKADFLRSVQIQSEQGFVLGLELTVKAHLMGRKIDEVPSTWVDRCAGESRFRIWKWMPLYLKWYFRAFSRPAVCKGQQRA